MSTQWQSAPQPPPGAYGGGAQSGPRAGFWIRFGAYLLDGIIFTVGAAIPVIIAAVLSDVLLVLVLILVFLASFGYYIFFEGSPAGATPGKRVCGIKIVDIDTGGPIGYGRSTIRYLMRIISGIPIYLGYLWMLWDPQKQCWHDKVARCVVVPADAYRSTV